MNKRTLKISLGFGIVLLVSGAALGVFTLKSGKQGLAAKPTNAKYDNYQVTRGDIKLTISTTGTVQPESRLVIKPPINGRIEDVKVREGEKVRKGQILALMSSTDRAALIDIARSKGDKEIAYWEDIYKPSPLIAPINGEIITRGVEPGQTISTADSAFVMSDELIVMAQVDETDIGKVEQGQTSEIVLDAYPNETIIGTASHIAFDAKTVNNVTVYNVTIKLKDKPKQMRSGMSASIKFVMEEKKDVLFIPVAMVNTGENKQTSVLVPGEDQEKRKPVAPVARVIEIGINDGKNVEIVSGLTDGETIFQEIFDSSKVEDQEKSTNPLMPKMPNRNRKGKGGGGGDGPPPPH